MVKTVSLADDAYADLVAVRRKDESFSELARRLSHLAKRNLLFDRTIHLDLTDREADEWIRSIYDARDRSLKPRYRA